MPHTSDTRPARWYVLQSKPKQEARAEANLWSWGVEAFVPRIREWRLSDDRERSGHTAPLFPNYLFARFDAATMIRRVRLTRGIHRVVGFGESATPVDDAIIELIRRRLSEDCVVREIDPHPGDIVEIVNGPLRSLVGVFDRQLQGKDRVLVLLTALESGARLHIAKTSIRLRTRSVVTAAG